MTHLNIYNNYHDFELDLKLYLRDKDNYNDFLESLNVLRETGEQSWVGYFFLKKIINDRYLVVVLENEDNGFHRYQHKIDINLLVEDYPLCFKIKKTEIKAKIQLGKMLDDVAKYMEFLHALEYVSTHNESRIFFEYFKITNVKKDGTIFVHFNDKAEFCSFNITLNEIKQKYIRFQGLSFWRDLQPKYSSLIKKIYESLNNKQAPIDNLKDILKSRQEKYGDSSACLEKISRYWSEFTGQEMSKQDVCIMMALLKLARIESTKDKGYDEDSLYDLAGYCVLAVEQK